MRPWLAAALLSGAPSTAHAVLTGRDPLEATKAAGAMVVGEDAPAAVRVVAAAPVHFAISYVWAGVLARALPERHRWAWGAAAGLAIAALDLGLIGRRIPAVRRLPLVPQLADHVVFGVVAGRRRS